MEPGIRRTLKDMSQDIPEDPTREGFAESRTLTAYRDGTEDDEDYEIL
ncbi:MAG TPA: hypothetical protein VJH90_03440 [archaeon]|nr:hypothetical protein [archaeon]